MNVGELGMERGQAEDDVDVTKEVAPAPDKRELQLGTSKEVAPAADQRELT